MSSTSEPEAPPEYIPTIYDETFRSVSYLEPTIGSIGNRPNLIGYFEHHAPTTDGSFSICVAGGEGVFVSKALLDSIPEAHRPQLNTTDAGLKVKTLFEPMTSIGSTFIPLILTNHTTGKKFRVVLYAIVLPKMFMGMFIGGFCGVATSQMWGPGHGPIHGFAFGEGGAEILVQGI